MFMIRLQNQHGARHGFVRHPGGLGNITDYASNFAFVQHVFMMDTTTPGNGIMYRAIASPGSTMPAISASSVWKSLRPSCAGSAASSY